VISKCPANSFSMAGSKNLTNCICGTGGYLLNGVCKSCPPGTYSTDGNGSACSLCPAGKFSNSMGASACGGCQNNSWSGVGFTVCRADVGYFLREYQEIFNQVGPGILNTNFKGKFLTTARQTDRALEIVSSNGIQVQADTGVTIIVHEMLVSRLLSSSYSLFVTVSDTKGGILFPTLWYKFKTGNCNKSDGIVGKFGSLVTLGIAFCVSESRTINTVLLNPFHYSGSAFLTRKGDGFKIPSDSIDLKQMLTSSGITISLRFQVPRDSSFSMCIYSITGMRSNGYIYTLLELIIDLNTRQFLLQSATKVLSFPFRYVQSMMVPIVSISKSGNATVNIQESSESIYYMEQNLISTPIDFGSYNFTIGRRSDGNHQLFGVLGDLRIFNSTLSSLQMHELGRGSVQLNVKSSAFIACDQPIPCPFGTIHCSPEGMPVCCSHGQYFVEGVDTDCQSCQVGFSSDGSGSTCVRCVAGQYVKRLSCEACIPGTYSTTESQTACIACAAGTFSTAVLAESSSVCQNCSAGTYQPVSGANNSSACLECNRGTYQPVPGANSSALCTFCQTGTYQLSSGASACVECSAGRFQSLMGADVECDKCIAGTYQPRESASVCLECTAGMYCIGARADPDPCPEHSVSEPGSKEASDCQCHPGYYQSGILCLPCDAGSYKNGLGPDPCVPCPENAFCPEASARPSECQAHSVSPGGSTAADDCR
jgi:hypothetical protein